MGCLNLGSHYYSGSDLFEKNRKQAFIYFKKSADLGNVDAAELVSYMYEHGEGCDKDINQAKKYSDMTKPKEDKKSK